MRRLFALPLLGILSLTACGHSPAAPSDPPAVAPAAPVTFADFSGLWKVQYVVTLCDLDRHCFAVNGTRNEVDVRLVQTGSRVQGLFVDSGNAVDIEGDVSSDGTLIMTGQQQPASRFDVSASVTELRFRRVEGALLEGTFLYEIRIPEYSEYPYPGRKVRGEIVSASRSELSTFAGTVDGTYRGRYIVRACAPVSTYCYPDPLNEVVDLTLTVSQAAGQASAIYERGGTRVPLQGSVTGNTLELAGETATVVSGGSTLDRISAWRSSVDRFGRMTGGFHLDHLFPIGRPTLGGGVECELVRLVKVTP